MNPKMVVKIIIMANALEMKKFSKLGPIILSLSCGPKLEVAQRKNGQMNV
jgi:hypothetical protein